MSRLMIRGFVLLVSLAYCSSACAQSRVFEIERALAHLLRRPEPETRMIRDFGQQPHAAKLLNAALVAAGNGPEEVGAAETAFAKHLRECRRRLGHAPDAAKLFDYLQREMLTGAYVPMLPDVGQTLRAGKFNCLTATVLFRCLCDEFAIEVQVAWQPSHVYCWLPVAPVGGYAVETTAQSWPHAIGPTQERPHDRLLSDAELIGKIFFNRAVVAMADGEYSSAFASCIASCRLDPVDRPAENNLQACLNNWALTCSAQDNSAMGELILFHAARVYPENDSLSLNLAYVRHNQQSSEEAAHL